MKDPIWGLKALLLGIEPKQIEKKKMKNLRTITLITIGILSTQFAQAKDHNSQPKSMTTAKILAFDPIPGDALFYARKPVQGTINMIIGGAGGAAFWYGLVRSFNDECRNSDCGLGALGAMTIGGAAYLPMLIWDAVGGIKGVKKHNEQIANQKKVSLRPNFIIAPDGGFQASLQVKF